MTPSDIVLVTGASGFVGRNLLPFLQRNEVSTRSLSIRDSDWKYNIPEDYLAIVHLAGKAHDTKNTSSPEEYFNINTTLTQELFDVFLQSNARDFVYFSSVKAVADTVDGILKEEVKPSPGTPYGQSKLQAEQYILSRELPPGKRVFIIRPCMIHGPGNKGNLNLLYKFVAKSIPYPLAAFKNKRSFLSIDNLCYAVKQILQDTNIAGGIYNLADDEALSTNEVVTTIAERLGKKPRLLKIPAGLLYLIARAGDILRLPLNTERLKKLTESYVVDNAKIKKALAIPSFPVKAGEGLMKTIGSFISE